MTIDDIKLLFEYNYWANKRILAKAEAVTTEQLTEANTSSWGSLFKTLIHTMDTEFGWRILLQDGGSTPLITDEDLPTLDDLKTRWDKEEAAMWQYLNSLSDEDLQKSYSADNDKLILWRYLVHVVNHGTQHRSEAAAMLTDFGHSPDEIDFSEFLDVQD